MTTYRGSPFPFLRMGTQFVLWILGTGILIHIFMQDLYSFRSRERDAEVTVLIANDCYWLLSLFLLLELLRSCFLVQALQFFFWSFWKITCIYWLREKIIKLESYLIFIKKVVSKANLLLISLSFFGLISNSNIT